MKKEICDHKKPNADIWAFWGHEPIQFYLRRNSEQNSIFAAGEWVPAWYERLHSEEALARLSQLGVNLITVHFYKSFGLAFERTEMLRTRELVKIAHRYGIRALGYASLNFVYAESLINEIPELEQYYRLDKMGRFSDTYRVRLCLNSEYYRSYFRRVLEYGWQEVGLDGFHFDNAISGDAICGACYCSRCTLGFRQFLESRLEPLNVGLPNFKNVQIPRLPSTGHPDPIEVQALHYIRAVYEESYGALFSYAKQISSGNALVLMNCGFADPTLTPAEVGHEIASARDVDYIFIETPDNFIRKTAEKLKSAVLAYKLAAMANVKALNTMWLNLEQGLYPTNAAAIKRVIAEAMIYDAVPGSNWAARSTRNGNRMIFDDQQQFSIMKQYFEFYQKNREYYCDTRKINQVKILYSPGARLLGGVHYEKILHLTAEPLTSSAIPYSLLLPTDLTENNDLILIPNAANLADFVVEHLRQLTRSNMNKLLFLGKAGIYRDDGLQRENPPFEEFEQIELPTELEDPLQLTKFQRELLTKLPQKIKLSPPGLMLETAVLATGERVYHLLHPENDKMATNVTLYDPAVDFSRCKIVSPQGTPDFTVKEKQVCISSFDTMCTIIVDGK